MATHIIRMPGKFRITLPDGSDMRNCEHRKYAPWPNGRESGIEWYVFHGKQFSRAELTRWGATIEPEATEPRKKA